MEDNKITQYIEKIGIVLSNILLGMNLFLLYVYIKDPVLWNALLENAKQDIIDSVLIEEIVNTPEDDYILYFYFGIFIGTSFIYWVFALILRIL